MHLFIAETKMDFRIPVFLFFVIAVLLHHESCAFEQSSGSQKTPSQTELQVESWLKDLQSGVFQKRQQAFLKLWRASPEIESRLEQIASSQDVDASATSKWLLLLRRLGTAPNDAAEGLFNLSLVRAGDFHTLKRLAENHQWGQVMVLLELLTEEQQTKLLEDVTDRELLLSMALQAEQDAIYSALVDRLYSPIESNAAQKLWRDFGFLFPENSPRIRTHGIATIYEMEWKGDVDGAIALAKSRKLDPIAQHILIRHSRWSSLRKDPRSLPKPDENRNSEILREASFQSLIHRWCDAPDSAKKWGDTIPAVPVQAIDKNLQAMWLIAGGKLDEGLHLLKTQSKRSAWSAYRSLGRLDEAFQLVGIDSFDQWDAEIWITSKIEEWKNRQDDISESVSLVAEFSSTLHRLGKREEAEKIEDAMLECVEQLSQGNELIADLIMIWHKHSRHDRLNDYLASYLQKHGSSQSFAREKGPIFEFYLETAYPEFGNGAKELLFELREQNPGIDWKSCLEQFNRLNHGSLPDGWRSKDFESYAWKAFDRQSGDDMQSMRTGLVLATIAKNLGLDRLSSELLVAAPRDLQTMMAVAKSQAMSGRFNSALQWIEVVCRQRPGDLGAQLLRAHWLEMTGKSDEAASVRRRAICIPISMEAYLESIATLREAHLDEDARKLLAHLWSIAEPNEEQIHRILPLLYDALESSDPEKAAEVAKASQLLLLLRRRPIVGMGAIFIEYQFRESSSMARQSIIEGNVEDALRWMDQAFSLRPEDIELPIQLVALAEKRKLHDFADRCFERYHRYHADHLEKWPMDSMFLNNIAWLSAKTRRKLDEAFLRAQLANELRPQDPTYMDTLAEVEFSRGNRIRAVEIELECQRLDGTSPHYKEQLTRFMAIESSKAGSEDLLNREVK